MLLAIFAISLAIIAYFSLRNKRGIGDQFSEEGLDKSYHALLLTHVEYYRNLNDADKEKFERLVYAFLQDTIIEGVKTEITDDDRVMIASSAVIPIMGFPDWRYKNLTSVILYPDVFNHEFQFEGENRNIMGMVGSGSMNGQMLLSRVSLVKGFSNFSGKENAAIHEFVHLLDKSDGEIDGIPEILVAPEFAVPWLKMMHQEMRRVKTENSDINPYALTNEAEFMAVAAEYFFTKPEKLRSKHPDIYQQLTRIFGQKPADL